MQHLQVYFSGLITKLTSCCSNSRNEKAVQIDGAHTKGKHHVSQAALLQPALRDIEKVKTKQGNQ